MFCNSRVLEIGNFAKHLQTFWYWTQPRFNMALIGRSDFCCFCPEKCPAKGLKILSPYCGMNKITYCHGLIPSRHTTIGVILKRVCLFSYNYCYIIVHCRRLSTTAANVSFDLFVGLNQLLKFILGMFLLWSLWYSCLKLLRLLAMDLETAAEIVWFSW